MSWAYQPNRYGIAAAFQRTVRSTMDTISTPKHERGSPGYNLDCQTALREGFQAFADAARAAGWDKGELAYALLELARFNLKGMIADGEIELHSAAA